MSFHILVILNDFKLTFFSDLKLNFQDLYLLMSLCLSCCASPKWTRPPCFCFLKLQINEHLHYKYFVRMSGGKATKDINVKLSKMLQMFHDFVI